MIPRDIRGKERIDFPHIWLYMNGYPDFEARPNKILEIALGEYDGDY